VRGHVKQRGKTWTYWVDASRVESGKRKQITKGGFGTKKEAEQALSSVLTKLDQGAYVEATKETVATFMRRWLDSIRASVRPSTYAGYENLIDAHIVPKLGAVPLQRLTPAQLNSFYADLLAGGRRDGKGGLSPRTVFYAHATIRKALAEAVRWQMLPRNIADLATPPKQRTMRELHTWSAAELGRFLEHIAGDRHYAGYYLAAFTGLRRGEVLGLRWRDVDLERGLLAVVQTVISIDYAVHLSTPKTAASRRAVALDPGTVEVLRAHRLRLVEERTALGLPWPSPDDLLFAEIDGRPLHPGQFSDRFDRLVKGASVPRVRFHDLRHTHASLMLTAGAHPKIVQERLGHANITVTLQTYSHVLPAMQEEAAAKFANVVYQGSR
jgi:integrase